MGNKQIRIGQLIAPFGPGSIYTDRLGIPHVVCGLDHWYKRWDDTQHLVPCDKRTEFERIEPRLSSLLKTDRFCIPPDYRFAKTGDNLPNAFLTVPALRFPRWYRNTKSGEMRRFNLHSEKIHNPEGGGRWQPVRFIAACSAGHLCEFPWKEWISCQCLGDSGLRLIDRGGSELSSIRIECRTCPPGSPGRNGKSLSGTTIKPNTEQGDMSAFQRAGITCPGDRPWLGECAREEGCAYPLVGALINQTNLYFPRIISAIALPDLQSQNPGIANLRSSIEELPAMGIAMTLWNMGQRDGAVALVMQGLGNIGIHEQSERIREALESLFDNSATAVHPDAQQPEYQESDLLAFRRAEFSIIRNEINDPCNIPNLRVIHTDVPSSLLPWFSRVNLVERLKETRVFFGFDRLEQNNGPLIDMPDRAMKQLFLTPPQQQQERWLPAVEVFGEGIYIELNENRIVDWQSKYSRWIEKRINDNFLLQMGQIYQTLPPLSGPNRDWASRYLLVHSLSHILINQFIFECGYSTASLRERLFISSDPVSPMAAFLIYTSAGDSEGTLGGLIQLGRPERLEPVVQRALGRASWCSADPVCSENLGGQGSRLANMAACHACILLPETCCETINEALDRAMVVGTPDKREAGFLSQLLEESYAY